jgi:predicted dehydrogenase
MEPLNIIVIGLGNQATEDHLPAIRESDLFNLLAVADVDDQKTAAIAEAYSVPGYSNVESLIGEQGDKIDVALIAVPHNEYLPIIEELASHDIDVIKEKPFATSISEAKALKAIMAKNHISIYVTLQRRFNPIFFTFKQLTKRIGRIYSIEGRYTLNIGHLDEGWRASKEKAGGGALMDMGYHFVDLVVWYFGLPDSITCRLSSGNRENQKYNVEDTALLNFAYNDVGEDDGRVLGSAIISRVYPQKEESLTAYGSKGSIRVEPGWLCRRGIDGNEIEVLERRGHWPSAAVNQLEEFANRIQQKRGGAYSKSERIEHFEHIAFIEASYDSNRFHDTRNPKEYLKRMADEK